MLEPLDNPAIFAKRSSRTPDENQKYMKMTKDATLEGSSQKSKQRSH